MQQNKYILPNLPYTYDELAPYMSAEQLTIHHQKHHNAYIVNANQILDELETSLKDEISKIDIKNISKLLSFNISGHILHSMFWENLAPENKGGGSEPEGVLANAIIENFGSIENFKLLFVKNAISVEGSGWAALTYCPITNKLLMTQIEKHNVNLFASLPILLVLDAFEHAYYIDYKNDKAKFFNSFWNIINWKTVEERLKKATQS